MAQELDISKASQRAKALNLLRTETRAALAAASRIPGLAAQSAWDYLLGVSADAPGAWPVYSGASRASLVCGLNGDLPPVPGEVLQVTHDIEERRERAANQDYVEHPDPDMINELIEDYDLDDDITIAINDEDVPYLNEIENKYGLLIEVGAAQVAEERLAFEASKFNTRSVAAQKGLRTRRRNARNR